MDYSMPDKRKTKRDKRAKRGYNKYKKGGKYRGTNVTEGSNLKRENKKKK
jgi:hypothetical protein